ncbi:MAG: TPM domain-containing protein [Oscillospiraceae bacterium]|nr:TPM domain-containing protein [Oscillospiraceae bacterium]
MNNPNNTEKSKTTMNEEAIKEKYLKLNKTKLQTAKLISVLMIAAALFFSMFVFNEPQKVDKSQAVYDKAEILSDATIQKIDERNAALAELTNGKAKIAVFTEKEKNNPKDLEKQAEKLQKSHVGDDGMLFLAYIRESSGGFGENIGNFFSELFGWESRPYTYHKGRNVDFIPDAEIKKILEASFEGIEDANFDCNSAFLAAYNSLADLFDAHYRVNSQIGSLPPLPELPPLPDFDDPPASNTAKIVQVAVGTAALFVILFFILGIMTGKKTSASRVYKKPFWFGLIG